MSDQKQRWHFSIGKLFMLTTLVAVAAGVSLKLGISGGLWAGCVVGLWFLAGLNSRVLFLWLVPVAWCLGLLGAWHHPGDEYGLFAVASFPVIMLLFVVAEFQDSGSIALPALIVFAVMVATGYGLDRLRLPRRVWVVVYLLATLGFCTTFLSQYDSMEQAIAKNGSINAYLFASSNLGVVLASLLYSALSIPHAIWTSAPPLEHDQVIE